MSLFSHQLSYFYHTQWTVFKPNNIFFNKSHFFTSHRFTSTPTVTIFTPNVIMFTPISYGQTFHTCGQVIIFTQLSLFSHPWPMVRHLTPVAWSLFSPVPKQNWANWEKGPPSKPIWEKERGGNSRRDNFLAGEEFDIGHGLLVAAKHTDCLSRLPQVIVVNTVVCPQRTWHRSFWGEGVGWGEGCICPQGWL